MSTLLQLAQDAKRESGLGDGPVSLATSSGDDLRFFKWVAWAWRDIDLMHEAWAWRRAMATANTDGTRVVPFGLTNLAGWLPASREYRPSAFKVSAGQSSENPLTFISYDCFRQQFTVGVHTAAPLTYWSVAPNGDFLVGPTPDELHTVRADYIKDHIPLAADGDIPTMPTRFHPLITWRALREYGGFDAASEVWQRADVNYKSLLSALSQAQLPRMRWGNRPLA